MKLLFYNLLFPFLFIIYLPFFIIKLIKRGGYNKEFWERFAIFTSNKKKQLQNQQKAIWIHAVSVGETVAALSFIKTWQNKNPKQKFVLSTTTTTGHALAKKRLPSNIPLIYCPIDFYPFVRKTVKLLKPTMLIIFEVEVWPNLVQYTASQCPVVLVNGRMSDKSATGYAKHSWFFTPLFSSFSTICVQSPEDAKRIKKIIAEKVPIHICNTMKFDQIPDSQNQDKSKLLQQYFGNNKHLIWTVGSTHTGEELLCAKIFKSLKTKFPNLHMILVPRHVERVPEIEKILQEQSLTYQLLQTTQNKTNKNHVEILLVNTTGELMNFYAMADIVFVGKTLAGNKGGHNIIEPAIFAKPIIHGNNMQNFRDVSQAFTKHNATITVTNGKQLETTLNQLLQDSQKRQTLGKQARQVVDTHRGAINLTINHIQKLLGRKQNQLK